MLVLAISITTVLAFTRGNESAKDETKVQTSFYQYNGAPGDNDWNQISKWSSTPSPNNCEPGDEEICGAEVPTGTLASFLSGHNDTSYDDALDLTQVVTRE